MALIRVVVDTIWKKSNLFFLHKIQAFGQGSVEIVCMQPYPQGQIDQHNLKLELEEIDRED